MRILGTSLDQPGQGQNEVVHKANFVPIVPEDEPLVSLRGSPDFWETGDILAAYRGQHSTAALDKGVEKRAVEAAQEHMGASKKDVDDAYLALDATQLWA